MNPVSEDIKDKLVTASLGTFAATTGWGIFLNTEPDSPDTTITIYDTGGTKPDFCMSRNARELMHPSFQVRVRSTTYLTAHTRMVLVVDALNDLAPWDVGTVWYQKVFQQGEPTFLRKDEHNRFIWVANFVAVRKET